MRYVKNRPASDISEQARVLKVSLCSYVEMLCPRLVERAQHQAVNKVQHQETHYIHHG